MRQAAVMEMSAIVGRWLSGINRETVHERTLNESP